MLFKSDLHNWGWDGWTAHGFGGGGGVLSGSGEDPRVK